MIPFRRGLPLALISLLAGGSAFAQDSRPAQPAADPVAATLVKARKAGALKRAAGTRWYLAGKELMRVVVKGTSGKADLEVDMTDYGKATSEVKDQMTCRMGVDGKLLQVGNPNRGLVGKVRDGKLVLTMGKAPHKTFALKAGTTPLALALFVLPAVYDHMPADGLPVALLVTDSYGPAMTLARRQGATQRPAELGKGGAVVAIELGAGPMKMMTMFVTSEKATRGRIEGFLVRRQMVRQIGAKQAKQILAKRKQGPPKLPVAVNAMKSLSVAQSLFREADKEGDGVLDYAADLAELGKANLISKSLASGKTGGYRFTLCHGSKAPEFLWMCVASPEKGKPGRHYAINHEGVIYVSDTPFTLDGKECKIKGGKPWQQK